MFYLHLSNKTEHLIRQLTEVLSLVENRDPFHPEYFLIQSQGMERMLSQRLSERFVSWCNYEYLLPTRFFALLAERLGVEAGPEDYGREQLSWRLEEILRTLDGAEFATLQTYVEGEAAEMKRYQLAGQLAYVFDQYQIMRPQMIDGWGAGRLSCTKNRTAEQYQMRLWNILAEKIGHSRHRGVFLADLIRVLNAEQDCSGVLPERLSVFGLHSMPPIFLECLQALSMKCHVHFYLLSPCETYWGDQTRVQSQLRQEDGDVGSGHPLLQALGQQGREFQNMLTDVSITAEFKSFEDAKAVGHSTLLQQVQSDLLQGEVAATGMQCSKDESITIVSAHSPHREMMILRDRILHWLDKDPDLSLKDIVVMAPDIQEYSALIPALFSEIPHSVADRNPVFSNRHIAAFLHFLQCCRGRFGWAEVLELLEKNEIYPAFDISETDLVQIRHWVRSSGIRLGLSKEQKDKMHIPGREECTWKAGLDRLLMGYAIHAEEPVHSILPYEEIEGGMAAPLGGLSLFCEILEQAQREFSHSRTLTEWSGILSGFVEKLFVSETENIDHLTELHKIISDIGLEYGTVHQSPVSFEVITAWLKSAASEKKSSAGFLRGQLTFCSMLPMRSIPFKKVCLLGLNDTVFPKQDTHPPFDLLRESFQPGDRSRRSDDRYQFLEAILSARESLYVSYVGQSIRSNDQLPPSVVVDELLELVGLYGVTDIVEQHPLHGFSEHYFCGESGFFTYNKEFINVAAAMRKTEPEPQPWWSGTVGEVVPESISVEELFTFFAHPQKYFVRHVLGVYPGATDEQYEEHEPFILDSLQNYLADQEIVQVGLLAQEKREQQLHKMQVAGVWPLATPGTVRYDKKEEEQQQFVGQLKLCDMADPVRDSLVDIEVNGIQITGTLKNIYATGSLLYRYANIKGKDVLTAWLQHCLSSATQPQKTETRLLAKDRELVFPVGVGNLRDLEMLVDVFVQGQHAPSSLLPEPAMAYAEQFAKTDKSGKGDPYAKAAAAYNHAVRNGYESEWELLYAHTEIEDVLGEEFLRISKWFYTSVWKQALSC